ncbi:MAG: hypothetical protein JRN39_03240 [Nitrososphaerota archaeon]|nr:hypothetical protein [Nitrososphaerota archaeon]MDG6939397.1 hypothetical protein [Nitrososphaerota archaeon]
MNGPARAVAALLLAGLALSASSSPASATALPTPIRHVIVIVMENQEFSGVIGNPSAPYQNALASEYALATQYYAAAHPSLPNYLALVGGSTFGVSSDCQPGGCSVTATNLADLLAARGLSWKEYAESMPSNCSQSVSPDGEYVPKHDPFVYFTGITNNTGSGQTSPYCQAHVVPFTQFRADLQGGALPNFAFITPNICDDAHSCSLSIGDAWLSAVVPEITSSPQFNSTVLFITYDEGSTNSGFGPAHGGRVVCIVVSPFARKGFSSDVPYSHYSLLATVESVFGLDNLGRNDVNATVMSDMFAIPLPAPTGRTLPGGPPVRVFSLESLAAPVAAAAGLALLAFAAYSLQRRSRRRRTVYMHEKGGSVRDAQAHHEGQGQVEG